MRDYYYAKNGLSSLERLKKLQGELYDSFSGFDREVFAEGALSVKTKELIALGCAHVTRCPYCIDAHARRARRAGATDEEISEAIFVAVAMNAGASLAHSSVAMDVVAGE